MLFLYIGTKKMSDLVVVLLKLRGDFFFFILYSTSINWVSCFVPVGDCWLWMQIWIKCCPSGVNIKLAVSSKHVPLKQNTNNFSHMNTKRIVNFSKNRKGFLLKPILQRELICYFTFQTGCFVFLRMYVIFKSLQMNSHNPFCHTHARHHCHHH